MYDDFSYKILGKQIRGVGLSFVSTGTGKPSSPFPGIYIHVTLHILILFGRMKNEPNIFQ